MLLNFVECSLMHTNVMNTYECINKLWIIQIKVVWVLNFLLIIIFGSTNFFHRTQTLGDEHQVWKETINFVINNETITFSWTETNYLLVRIGFISGTWRKGHQFRIANQLIENEQFGYLTSEDFNALEKKKGIRKKVEAFEFKHHFDTNSFDFRKWCLKN